MMDAFFEAYMKDDEPQEKKSQRLLDLYAWCRNETEETLMNEIFITLTGFSFKTLCAQAGIRN